MSEFATNCPESNCPPLHAADVGGEVYLFVRNDPPVFDDFKTYADKGREEGDPCQRCALSVLVRQEDIPIARKAMPWFKKRKIARADLKPEHGKICQTGENPCHFSLWVRAIHKSNIHQLFTVVSV